jgi:tetratricopeptide (TPR) repeat protein
LDLNEKYKEACGLLDNGRLDEAITILDEVLSRDGEQYYAINKKGVALARKNELGEAEILFRSCLDINPDYAPAWVNMGNLRRQNGDNDKAIKYYGIAIENDPEYHYAYYNLAAVYKSQKNYNEYYKNLKKYKRTYRHYITDSKKEISDKVNKNKNMKYSVIFIFACIVVGMALIGGCGK